MRAFYLLLLIIMLAALGVFVVQNHDPITLRYLDRVAMFPLAAVVGAAYVLGMFSGWTVVGLFRRSLKKVTQRPSN
jgi:lipopolysaccharide assembly protein A